MRCVCEMLVERDLSLVFGQRCVALDRLHGDTRIQTVVRISSMYYISVCVMQVAVSSCET